MTYVTEPFLTEAEGLAGSLVIEARAETGLSQTELARRSGVPRSVISAVEHGRRQPSLPTLMRILLGAGLDLRTRLAPHDDQDEVLEALRQQMSPRERLAADRAHEANVAAFAGARSVRN
jgi:transcriptional regulator with XRE-family HTH domain